MITCYIVAEYTSTRKDSTRDIKTVEEGYSKAFPETEYRKALRNAIWQGAYKHIAHNGSYNWTHTLISYRYSYISRISGGKTKKITKKQTYSYDLEYESERDKIYASGKKKANKSKKNKEVDIDKPIKRSQYKKETGGKKMKKEKTVTISEKEYKEFLEYKKSKK
jgi:hypothetical protein